MRPDIKPQPIRRIITGHTSDGQSCLLSDGSATTWRAGKFSGHFSTLIWSSDSMPVPIPVGTDAEDMGARILGTAPPPNGSRFMIAEFPPGIDLAMHRTESVDYIIVLEGQIDMILDDGTSVTAGPHDVIVQRGTNHRWRNPYSTTFRAAFVMLDAEPLGIGKPVERGIPASSL